MSELFPHTAKYVDDLAIVRSMKSEFPLHARGNIFLHTGRNIGGYPSLGSWITYGLGSDNKNLPGYVLLRDASIPPGGIENFSNGFLPGTHQATHIRDEGVPVDNIIPADRDGEDTAGETGRSSATRSRVPEGCGRGRCRRVRDLEL